MEKILKGNKSKKISNKIIQKKMDNFKKEVVMKNKKTKTDKGKRETVKMKRKKSKIRNRK